MGIDPHSMVSEHARREAGQVLQFARGRPPDRPRSGERSRVFIQAVDTIVTEAVEQEGAAREIVTRAGEVFSQRELREETLQAFQENYVGPHSEEESEEETVITGSAYLAAGEILNDPDKQSEVMEVLRSPEENKEAILDELDTVDEEFRDAFLLEAAKERRQNSRFRSEFRNSLKELRGMRDTLTEIGSRGEGREQGWQISVVLVCPLAMWLCVALLVAFIVIFVWIWVNT